MKSSLTLFLLSTALIFSHLLTAAGTTAALPSYADSVAAYQGQQAGSGGPRISEADQEVMARAKQDLAKHMPDPGLEVGAKAPDFTLANAFGKPVNLYTQLAKGPVILSFYRGAWCPFCNLQLRGLRDALPYFERHQAQLITITPQLPDKSLEQVKKDGYPFEILSDLDSEVMKAYALYFEVPVNLSEVYQRNFALDLATYNGPGRYVLPVPGTFVIDRHPRHHPRGLRRYRLRQAHGTRRYRYCPGKPITVLTGNTSRWD